MPITKDSYFKYLEHKAQSGYRAALLVKEQSATLYSMLVASETVPSVFGTVDSFEFDLMNSPVKGKVEGKMSLEDKEIEVLHHRDNVYRFELLKGKVLDFMVVDGEFVGYQFSGTLSYRMNDATSDILRGTVTITPMSASTTPIMDARALCQETLCFSEAIPESVGVGVALPLGIVQGVTASYTISQYNEDTKTWGTATNLTASTGGAYNAPSTAGLYAITASASGYAPWTTTVRVG